MTQQPYRRPVRTCCWLFMILCFLGWMTLGKASAMKYVELETTREEFLASRQRRADQLEKLLTDAKQSLRDHQEGNILLDAESLHRLEKKIDVFSKKMEELRTIPDERELERMLERERLIRERHRERRERRSEL